MYMYMYVCIYIYIYVCICVYIVYVGVVNDFIFISEFLYTEDVFSITRNVYICFSH